MQKKFPPAAPLLLLAIAFLALFLAVPNFPSRPTPSPASIAYLGLDRNQYPGDDALPALRKSFSFTSYWLSPPPGEKSSSWAGKRALLQAQGFGFALLYLGKTSHEIRTDKIAEELGVADAQSAAAAAKHEGFPAGSLIFLDEEEGGRYLPGQLLYLRTWAEALLRAGFRPGFYCSGIPVDEGEGRSVVTANQIREHIGIPDVVFWVYNDACPPSPGCAAPKAPPPPAASGVPCAAIWQFVRSPRDKKISRHCNGYAADGNCFAPGDAKHQWFLDLNSSTTPDPSAPLK